MRSVEEITGIGIWCNRCTGYSLSSIWYCSR